MSDDSKIEWTDATWNPIRGCSRVSEGCRHCYAERVAARFSGPGMPYEGLVRIGASGKPTGWNGTVRMVPEHLADPLRWRRPRRVFVNSMSDLFHDDITNEQIAAVFGVMAASPRHSFQVLTKRARRMREWFRWASGMSGVNLTGGAVTRMACDPLTSCRIKADRLGVKIPPADIQHAPAWPLGNVWLGVSVENQAAADERIPELLRTPAAVRWISAEPLLGPVEIRGERDGCGDCDPCIGGHPCGPHLNALHPDGITWIVAGCESGLGARPCDVAWLRSLRDQCAAAGVAFFLKQAIPSKHVDTIDPPLTCGPGSHRKAGGIIGLPYLDGVQHAAMPEVRK